MTIDVATTLAALSLEQKAALLDGADFWNTKALPEHGIPAMMLTDGPHGLRKQAVSADSVALSTSVPATCFPPAAGLASSWDPSLARRVGEALGDECRVQDVAVLLGPGVNMKRTPLCGRNFEYFSEDPLLAGTIASGWVAGVQSRGVGTSLKHFAANNQETDRMRVSAEVDERTLREVYLPAFERVVTEQQPWTVMCSYNRINGVYASEDPWLLTEVLRNDWGFRGLVVSDWGAVDRREVGLEAGLDLEMPSSVGVGTQMILEAVACGALTEAQVDLAVSRMLELVNRAGRREPLAGFDADAHHALAREAARASIVLLKNEQELLPLDPERGGMIAVIGEFARTPRYQGAGSSQVNPTKLESALDSLQALLEGRREVVFAGGFEIEADQTDPSLVDEAVRVAADAEVAVVFLGLPPSYESEGLDRDHMGLPEPQLELLSQVAAANPNVVVVLSNGAVVLVSGWEHQARAVLECWLLGQAGGGAVADVLLGIASPSGRLAETIPERYLDNPTVGNFPGDNHKVRYGEGLLIGYRWYDAHELPVAYPFGHGLSYTTFAYSELALTVLDDGPEPRLEVAVTVANTGSRPGVEVVQVYVGDPIAGVERPIQELRAFTNVSLDPGTSKRVALELDHRAFAYWHVGQHKWVVEGGDFVIGVGASSRDIRLAATVSLTGVDAGAPLWIESTIAEFFAQPDAHEWMMERLGASNFGLEVLETDLGQILKSVPVRRFARLPGSGLTEADIEEFLAARTG